MRIDPPDTVKTVSQITSEIKLMLEAEYRFVAVNGEISNLRKPFSGHQYFTLKDNNAQIRAVLFKGQQRYLADAIKDGQQVICRGRISVYEPRGEYQLIVDTVTQHGVGMLEMQFAALKKKLAEEGLFDQDIKKLVPQYPQKIVVISSPTGAAVHDFLKICRQRKTPTSIQVIPVAVQGKGAAEEIVRAIELANKRVSCDAIVICRGGGSLEDLWAFNEEVLARAIFRSDLPVVSAIGHEIDTTISDFCADLRAPTPTGAAEMIIPDGFGLAEEIRKSHITLRRLLRQKLHLLIERLNQQTRVLSNFPNRLENASLRVDLVIERFQRGGQHYIDQNQRHLEQLLSRLDLQAPQNRIEMLGQKVEYLQTQLVQQMMSHITENEHGLAKGAALLQGVSPLSTLSRGYSIVQVKDKASGKFSTINNSRQVEAGDRVNVLLHQGRLECEILESLAGDEETLARSNN